MVRLALKKDKTIKWNSYLCFMQEETKAIFDHSFEYAANLLEETKEFYPFGAFTDKIGQVHPLEFDVDKNNVPNNGKVIATLEKYCEEELEKGNITAYGLTYEVQIQLEENKPATDAIALKIVSNSEKNIPIFYQPFTTEAQKVTFETIFAVNQ